MYAKLFSRITESSIIEESITTRWVFVALLAIAESDGTVIGTDIAIARRINVPLKDFEESMKVLMSGDSDSNNQEFEGKRVLPSEGERGYFLTGYTRYRSLKTEEERRIYMKEYMANRRKNVNSVNSVNIPLAQLTHAEAEGDTYIHADESNSKANVNELFESFWMVYPKKKAKGKARTAFDKALKIISLEEIMVSLEKLAASPDWLKERGKYVPYPASWLNAEGWHDQVESINKPKMISDGVEISKHKSW